jgi:hypothetical protein
MINFKADLDAVLEMIGTFEGINEAYSDAQYLDDTVTRAHREASLQFDLAAAASAGAGYLSHVYEFGVPGITAGPPRISDPTSPAARLWTHNISGTKGMYSINYVFRPAVVPNPQPTKARTGVPSKYLRKLSKRKYVFHSKAFVMETGMEVEITSKEGRRLFVPFYGMPKQVGNKTYMMYDAEKHGPINTTPGRNTAGTFTAFWEGWWAAQGTKIMEDNITESASADMALAFKAAAARAARIAPTPPATNVNEAVEEKAKKTTKYMLKRNAAARNVGQERR